MPLALLLVAMLPIASAPEASPEARFERVKSGFVELGPAAARREVVAILEANPAFAQADEALLWLGDRAYDDGDLAEARRRYRELLERFPASARAPHAWAGIGRAAFAAREWEEAEDAYAKLATTSLSGAELVSRAEVEKVRRHRARDRTRSAVLAFLALAGVGGAATIDPRRLRGAVRAAAGRELLFAAPVLAILVVVAPDEGRAPVAGLAAAALAMLFLTLVWADACRAAFARGPLRVFSTLGGTLAGAAVLYLVLHRLDLLPALEAIARDA